MSEPFVAFDRWTPVRAGIRNIWEYDDQLFAFAGGRLVLRGPNGSGKSNALALLVPFLLDGVMAANRMDSLGGARSMKSLLLCLSEDGGPRRFRHEKRTGYVWIEFERGDRYLSIGCGARASVQRDAEAWFFVTDRRPDIDLDLAPGGAPLSRGALADAIGAGAVHDSAEAHRAAVDRALFGLGPHRYRNLVELLLVLRRPHLAGKLNLEHLSKVLSDGLAALDDQLITDVAASFDDLEAVQRDLRRLQEADRTVHAFLPTYRRYLRATARTRALAATEAAKAVRAAKRRVVDAEKAVVSATEEINGIRRGQHECDERREVAEQRQRAVLESPAYGDARSLVEVDERAGDASRNLDAAEQRLDAAAGEAGEAAADLATAAGALTQATTEVDQAFTAAAEGADLAGAAWPLARSDVEGAHVARVVRALADERRHHIAEVRTALAAAEAAAVRARTAADAAARAAEHAEQAEETRREAARILDDQRVALARDLTDWSRASGIPELDSLTEKVDLVGEPGEQSLDDAATDALRPRRDDLAARHARAEDQAISLAGDREQVAAERQRVAAEAVPAPDRVGTRPADRTLRQGAPLYACCDFAEGVAADERAGLEAAIEAAGLLDAWIGEHSDELDAWLRPLERAPAPTLADVLVPTPPNGSGLSAEAVTEVLASISLADAGIAVNAEGRFGLGPLVGRFAKAQAEFIGATAREHRRQRLLAELDERLAEIDTQLAAVHEERAAIAVEQRRLDEILASQPSPAGVLAARDALLAAVARAASAREAAERDQGVSVAARDEAEECARRLRAAAGERRLPATADGLAEAERRVQAYEQQASGLIHAVSRLADRRATHERAAGRVARAEAQRSQLSRDRDDVHRQLTGLRARVDQLRAQLGDDAEAPLRALNDIEAELRQIRAEADRLSGAALDAADRRGRAVQEHEAAAEAVAGLEHAAAGAAAGLDVLCRPDVWTVLAGADSPGPPAEAGELARLVASATADVSAEADDNALQRAFRLLLDDLRQGYDPSLSYVDHVAVVEVTSDAGTFSVLWLAGELAQLVARQQELLSERDREIFERHLLTRVSEALRELLNDADELVERINRSLADRPTASGKSVKLRWEVDTADPAARSALALLRKTPELLGPDERDQLRRFFSTAIAQRRAEDAAVSYAEILRQVLDYRAWHTFVPYMRSAGGGLQKLTRNLFRTLSGGEQAVVLHLPLFAAAAAHYDAAEPGAPRMIALDEAFAGIDEGMRAELMGLLVRFDLDVVLTGHELWGAYEQVPALQVYDLLRQPPLEGVSAFALRWDGAAMAEA